MGRAERDEMMEKFRKGLVNVIICTDLLARGVDVPEIEIVINYDVPTHITSKGKCGDAENYMHRIGRTGRFGTQGIAVTIYDRDEDKVYLDQIMETYSMKSRLKQLEGHEHLKKIFEQIHSL